MCDPIPEFPLHEHNFYVRDTKFRPYKVKEGMVFIFLEYAIDNGSRQAVKVETRSFQPMRDESESEDPDVELLKQITDGIFKVGDEIKISGSIIFTAYYKADTKQLKYAPTLRIKSFRAGRASYSMPSRHQNLDTLNTGASRGQPERNTQPTGNAHPAGNATTVPSVPEGQGRNITLHIQTTATVESTSTPNNQPQQQQQQQQQRTFARSISSSAVGEASENQSSIFEQKRPFKRTRSSSALASILGNSPFIKAGVRVYMRNNHNNPEAMAKIDDLCQKQPELARAESSSSMTNQLDEMELTADYDETKVQEDFEEEELTDNRRARKRHRTNENQPMDTVMDAPDVAKTAVEQEDGQCSNSGVHVSAKPSTTTPSAQTQNMHPVPPPSR